MDVLTSSEVVSSDVFFSQVICIYLSTRILRYSTYTYIYTQLKKRVCLYGLCFFSDRSVDHLVENV